MIYPYFLILGEDFPFLWPFILTKILANKECFTFWKLSLKKFFVYGRRRRRGYDNSSPNIYVPAN